MYKRKSQKQYGHDVQEGVPETVGTPCTRGNPRNSMDTMYKRESQRQYGHDVQEEVLETDGTDTMYKRKSQRQQGHDVQEEVPETVRTGCTRGGGAENGWRRSE